MIESLKNANIHPLCRLLSGEHIGYGFGHCCSVMMKQMSLSGQQAEN
jgi:hypothetical protein